uniref:protein-glutamine gamma-glutamyltransferase n=1 Tax=Phascolarctos cinereus TaxID=38626 RepID=A0A6P5M8V5_PHACI|nr:LOW QUALITY PROTEIN: protein-glutamine gamma-glutamyltransferase Z [Phascolarctos cinereus]
MASELSLETSQGGGATHILGIFTVFNCLPLLSVLGLRSSNLQSPKNNKEHHTSEIGSERLFVRRAQAFVITLNFDRPFHAATDKVIFTAETGPQPTESLGTKVRFVPSKARDANHWSVFDFSTYENSLQVSLSSPAHAIIGRYLLKVEISQPSGQAKSFQLGEFILLFNPWNSEDEVYLPSETQLQEYIMMDYGFIFKGHENWITPWPWNYGQFEDDIIDICFEILDKNLNFLNNPSKDYSQRNSVMYICRVVSAMINSNDDNGVLQGNWSEDHSTGVNPLEWNGSVTILRQWHATGGQPVRYGQCWVFAAVMCTVMRCLGVPTRVVTNFRSAHNTDGNLTVDMFYDKRAEMVPWERRDKIWNFHVWNECWMTRKDLPAGYDGWQVLDPTPQETSRGVFCCGPASVKAVKEGDIQLAYDTPFVFAEVNADEVIWLQDSGQVKEILSHNTSTIGKKISTKMVGSDKRQDITNSYKYPEGSAEERSVFMKASRMLLGPTGSSYPYMERMRTAWFQEKPVKLQLKLARTPEWGQDLAFFLRARRLQGSEMGIKQLLLHVWLSGQALLHGGNAQTPLWRDELSFSLVQGEEKELPITLPFTHYKDQISDEKLIRLSGIVEIEQTRRKLLVIKDISLELPHLIIEVFGRAVVDKKLSVSISFTNTQSEPLQNCVLMLEGSGLIEGQMTINLGTIQSGDTIQAEVDLLPTKEGSRQLQVLVSCEEVKEIKGYKDIFVASASSS